MSFEVGKKALDFLVANSGNRVNLEVDFFGGEPLMNWDVVKQLVEYGRSLEEPNNKKFRFTLTTNGVLLNDEIMEYLNKEMSNVVLSLDGRKEVNDRMRPFRTGKGSYDLIVPKFQKLADSRNQTNYYVRGTFTRDNLDFSEDVNINTTDELNELGKNINIMSKSISSSIDNLNSFVSNASHELKTPITVINTHVQALLNGTITDEKIKKDYYRVLLKESREMTSLVNDLLLISKLSSLEKKLDKEECSFLNLLNESIEKFEFLELKKDIEWDIKIKNLNIFVNNKLFKVVLDNLVNNALKYSPKNSIINIYQEDNNIIFENPMYLIEKENIDNLFQPFYRGTSANELNIEGSGLGLSLIKRILDLHSISYSIKIEKKYFKFILTY